MQRFTLQLSAHLVRRCSRDVEPLIDAGINERGGLVLARGNVERLGVGAIRGVGDGGIGQGQIFLRRLARNELLPCLGAFTDNVHGVLLVLALSGEGELVFRLAIWDFVDAEPLIGSAQQTRQVAFDILDVVELGCQRVVNVDDHDLPVSLALVEQSHDTEDLDLDDISGLRDELANLANV